MPTHGRRTRITTSPATAPSASDQSMTGRIASPVANETATATLVDTTTAHTAPRRIAVTDPCRSTLTAPLRLM